MIQGMADDGLPIELRSWVEPELQPNERVGWWGHPSTRVIVKHEMHAIGIGSIILIVIAILMWFITEPGLWWLSVAMLGFVPVLFLILMLKHLFRRGDTTTIYLITNERAMVMRRKLFGRRSVESFYPRPMLRMLREETPDGSGDLIFEQFINKNDSGNTVVKAGFHNLASVQDAEDAARRILLKGAVRSIEPDNR